MEVGQNGDASRKIRSGLGLAKHVRRLEVSNEHAEAGGVLSQGPAQQAQSLGGGILGDGIVVETRLALSLLGQVDLTLAVMDRIDADAVVPAMRNQPGQLSLGRNRDTSHGDHEGELGPAGEAS